jgi:Tfp pilus assembly protein PilZ
MTMAVAQSNPGEFSQLVDELVELEQERTAPGSEGLSGERAVQRSRIERRLMHLLCAEIAADERRGSIRVPTNLGVQVKLGAAAAAGKLTNVGVGGAFIESEVPAALGDEVAVTVERGRDSFEHTFVLRGRVAWLSANDGRRVAGFGVAFATATDAEERRLRRLVLDLLRAHSPNHQ